MKQILSYFKDYRFNGILLRYFLLLFICFALPAVLLCAWFGKRTRDDLREKFFEINESALERAHGNVDSEILTVKNVAYNLTTDKGVRYLAGLGNVHDDTTGSLEGLRKVLEIIYDSHEYIDSVCVYFPNSEEVVSQKGTSVFSEYDDPGCLQGYTRDMPGRTVLNYRAKNGKYPYLLTVLTPIAGTPRGNLGAVIINIDVEALGRYIGNGQYRNSEYVPMLLVLDDAQNKIVYSDEWRLLRDEEEAWQELEKLTKPGDGTLSQICELWGRSFLASSRYFDVGEMRYLYLSSLEQFESQKQEVNRLLLYVTCFIMILCFVITFLLAVWVYSPIRKTLRLLERESLLMDWDREDHLNEMEMIQKSILSARKKQDNLNEEIQERLLSLHNAQLHALQTQINPHFLYNTLESIGNASVLLSGESDVSRMIYTLGKLMRISLSGETYLVPLEEELEHVKLYVQLIDFRFHGRIQMHFQVPEELYREKIVKLTLQPLIENAVEHGGLCRKQEGHIWIKGEQKGEKNYIYVIDDGVGISPERLAQLRARLQESELFAGKHVGLRNVNERLKLVFGEDCGLAIDDGPEGGVCVEIRFRKSQVVL